MSLKTILVLLLGMILFIGCVKDPVSTARPVPFGAYILNEGNFGKSTGSLSFLAEDNLEIQNHIYEQVNGQNPGDVVQNMTIVGKLGYIVVNNSDKIEIMDLKTWKKVGTISTGPGSSPRQMVAVSQSKAYVSNLYLNSVSVLNLNDSTVTGSITVGLNPDEMTLSGDYLFVGNNGFGYDHTVSVIDITSDQIVKTIMVGDNPSALFTDGNGDVQVLCTGRYPSWTDTTDKGSDGGLYRIDGSGLMVTDSLRLTGFPTRLAYDGQSTAYFLQGGSVVSYNTETMQKINTDLINGFFYGISVHPKTGKLYLFDALDYSQNGMLKIYTAAGELESTFETGIIPHRAVFYLE